MIKAIDRKKVEGCLDGTNVYDILFSSVIDRDFINILGEHGKLIFKDRLKKPFFKIIVRGELTLKGTLGNKTIRVILPDEADPERIDEFLKKVTAS